MNSGSGVGLYFTLKYLFAVLLFLIRIIYWSSCFLVLYINSILLMLDKFNFSFLPPMSRKAQKMPDRYQEGSYVTNRRGKTRNIGKTYMPTQSRSKQPVEVKKPPPLEVRHHGDQNDMDPNNSMNLDADYSMNLDPTLPTEEEVRGSYGNVFSSTLKSPLITHCGIDPE
jgi:hypothetical protein